MDNAFGTVQKAVSIRVGIRRIGRTPAFAGHQLRAVRKAVIVCVEIEGVCADRPHGRNPIDCERNLMRC